VVDARRHSTRIESAEGHGVSLVGSSELPHGEIWQACKSSTGLAGGVD
jgi:hypothetical protein